MVQHLMAVMIGTALWAGVTFCPQDQVVDSGHQTVTVLTPSIENAGGPTHQSDQILSTMVQDPANPKEPWEITTYRRSGESTASFIKRHKDMVDSVRDALGT